MSNFQNFQFDDSLSKRLQEIGYETPTPVQQEAIPQIIQGTDLIVSAQTGTGKTGAFLLPALNLLTKLPKQRSPRVLILAPTRELAMQIQKEAENFSRYLPSVKSVCIYGGVPYPPQRRDLSKPFDILVATPGRLMDHMQRGLINLSKIRIAILDEADRMLDMGFLDAVGDIMSKCPAQKQTLLFSATIDKKILRISQELQKNPVEVRIEPAEASKGQITQKLYHTDDLVHKMKLLDHLLENELMNQAIVFTSTKRQADIIADSLKKNGKRAEPLHGDMNQRQRSRAVMNLRKNRTEIIVATDVAARGIDVPSLGLVINVDLPFKAEDYIHRIGRTGRAGATGTAITFVSRQDQGMLQKIESLIGEAIQVHTIEGLEPKKSSESVKKKRPFRPHRKFQHARKRPSSHKRR